MKVAVQVALSGFFFGWFFLVVCLFLNGNSCGSMTMFFYLFNLFLGKNIPPISPEAEVSSCMEKTPTSKPRQSDVDQMNKVQ